MRYFIVYVMVWVALATIASCGNGNPTLRAVLENADLICRVAHDVTDAGTITDVSSDRE